MLEGVPVALETEVVAKAQRRRFTAAEKLRVLRQADGCAKPGEVSALLRREGLYSSHLASWRAARQRGELAGLAPRARGPKAKPVVHPGVLDARFHRWWTRGISDWPNSSATTGGSRRGLNAPRG